METLPALGPTISNSVLTYNVESDHLNNSIHHNHDNSDNSDNSDKNSQNNSANKKKEVVICVQKQFLKCDSIIQIRDIGNQLANLLYGKTLFTNTGKNNSCYGRAQTIKIKQTDILQKKISVNIPSNVVNSTDPICVKIYKDVQNIIRHGKTGYGIDISVCII